MTTKTITITTGLKKDVARAQGSFDSKSRWDFTDSRVGFGSRCEVCGEYLRAPSASYPYSVLKHAYSKKHAMNCLKAGIVTESDMETEEREVKTGPATTTGYKIVRVLEDGRMVSLMDGETEYQIGETLQETAKSDHNGGYYLYEGTDKGEGHIEICLDKPSTYDYGVFTTLTRRFIAGKLVPKSVELSGNFAVIECEGEGRKLRYSGGNGVDGKLAFSRLTPIQVLCTFTL